MLLAQCMYRSRVDLHRCPILNTFAYGSAQRIPTVRCSCHKLQTRRSCSALNALTCLREGRCFMEMPQPPRLPRGATREPCCQVRIQTLIHRSLRTPLSSVRPRLRHVEGVHPPSLKRARACSRWCSVCSSARCVDRTSACEKPPTSGASLSAACRSTSMPAASVIPSSSRSANCGARHSSCCGTCRGSGR